MTANDGIVLVTGGSRGIGAATATLLTRQGHGLPEAPGAQDTRL
jgi:NAD(P)-dependent dehydrogenase (short-subunit alcohol dehydrogenase family)